jgi:D-alanyl-D-alanine carboxypeptidase
MLTKLLVTISVILNPFAFLVSQSIPVWPIVSEVSLNNISEEESQWDQWAVWRKSLISAWWFANPNFLPIRDWGISEPAIEAKAALVFELDKDKILYQKNIDQVLPIASLTKLMTALIVLENMNLEEVVTISKQAIAAYGDQGDLVIGEEISIKNLLYALLVESSNDAAVALAEHYDSVRLNQLSFVDLMNEKAKALGLKNTHFVDPSGYEPANVSTVKEIVHLVEYSLNQPLLWQILKTPVIDLSSVDGRIHHHWINTDELLNRLPNIIGGKTGYTEEAQGCLVLVVEPFPSGRLITVVLGAEERFLETERLIEWVERAYKW